MMTERTYQVLADRRSEIERKLAALGRKAAKYGAALEAAWGEPYATEVAMRAIDHTTSTVYTKGTVSVWACDLTIRSEEIRAGEAEVVARIEHLTGGNIVTAFGAHAVKDEWRTAPCTCGHCGTHRDRRNTYIVRRPDGTETQVGRSCLRDYCGIDPQAIGWREQLEAVMVEEDPSDWDYAAAPMGLAYSVADVLAVALRVYKAQGYVKSGEPGSNKDKVIAALQDGPTGAERAAAAPMVAAIAGMDSRAAADVLLDNTQVLIRSGEWCKISHVGYLAYAPAAYDKWTRREAERAAAGAKAGHVGQIGERITVDVAEAKCLTSWETQYGHTWLYRFETLAGEALLWFASRPIKGSLEAVRSVKGTVKDHRVRDGENQTVLMRCAVC